MRPILLHVGAVEIPAYLTMIMFGFFAAALIARRDGGRAGVDEVAMVDLCILMLMLGVVGARLLAVLSDGFLLDFVNLCTNSKLVDPIDTGVRFCTADSQCGGDYLCDLGAQSAVVAGERRSMCYPPQDCLAVFKFWQGGLTFYGGMLLAIPGGMLFARRRNIGALLAADLLAPALMLALAVGRVGCFLNGCCYGAETAGSLGVLFPGHYLERHPTQLYESLFALALFAVLRWLLRPLLSRDGQLFGAMLTSYGVFRLGIELLRDDPRGALGPLSTSQIIALPLFVAGIGLLLLKRPARAASPPK
ncbi:MAG: prolipoprotein diacylglyceryl transferase [Myxococcales bacterium]|nr:prolipoprotein diacylglyceryl transferase [Myxococcales bacterium]